VGDLVRGKLCVLRCEYSSSLRSPNFKSYLDLAIHPKTAYPEGNRPPMIPDESVALLAALQDKRRRVTEDKEKFTDNIRDTRTVLEGIAGYIGNRAVTYDEHDAPHAPDDPADMNQGERVLRHKRATCEGG